MTHEMKHGYGYGSEGTPCGTSRPRGEQGELPLLDIETLQRAHDSLHAVQLMVGIASIELPARDPLRVAPVSYTHLTLPTILRV